MEPRLLESSTVDTNPPKLHLDSLSRDELLTHAKKQLVLLRKTKLKCDDLVRKTADVQATVDPSIQAKLEALLMEKESLNLNMSTLENKNRAYSQEITNLQAQLDCMLAKQNTANETFACLREEINLLQAQNKNLKELLVAKETIVDCGVSLSSRPVAAVESKQVTDTVSEQNTTRKGSGWAISDEMDDEEKLTTLLEGFLGDVFHCLFRARQSEDAESSGLTAKQCLQLTKELKKWLNDFVIVKNDFLHDDKRKQLHENPYTVRDENAAQRRLKSQLELIERNPERENELLLLKNEILKLVSVTAGCDDVKQTDDISVVDLVAVLKRSVLLVFDMKLQRLPDPNEELTEAAVVVAEESDTQSKMLLENREPFDAEHKIADDASEHPLNRDAYVGSDIGRILTVDTSTDPISECLQQAICLAQCVPDGVCDVDCKQELVGLFRLDQLECLKRMRESKAMIRDCIEVVSFTEDELRKMCALFKDHLETIKTDQFSEGMVEAISLYDSLSGNTTGGSVDYDSGGFLVNRDRVVHYLECLKSSVDVVYAVTEKCCCQHKLDLDCNMVRIKEGIRPTLVKENEDLVSKYKAVAIKSKKEAADSKKKLESLNLEFAIVKSSLEEELSCVRNLLNEERRQHKMTTAKLEQHSNIMSLEIADFERHAADLERQLADREALVGRLEADVASLLERLQGMNLQIEQLEDQSKCNEIRSEQLKAVSVKQKKEISDLQAAELQWKSREGVLVSRLESTNRELESLKVEFSECAAANDKLRQSGLSADEANQRSVQQLENQIASLVSEVNKLRLQCETCQAEYDSYKIRVRSVYNKDQKAKGVSDEKTGIADDEKAQLEKIIEKLQAKVQELGSSQLFAVQAENENLQTEHLALLQRHNKVAAGLAEQEASWRQRVEKLLMELQIERQENSEIVRQLKVQRETVEAALERQLDVEQVNQTEVQKLHERLGAAEAKIRKLQSALSRAELFRPSPPVIVAACRDDDDDDDLERQEGEGSDFPDTSYSAQRLCVASPSCSFIPLEQLLNENFDKISTTTGTSAEVERLEGHLALSSRKIEHLTEILHESEATNARMVEQNRVLKDEIRRLERNQEREEHMANMEYLKNVIVKFLFLTAGDERERLVPVLKTILRLSPEEEETVLNVARRGMIENLGTGSSWSDYLAALPRWPGN